MITITQAKNTQDVIDHIKPHVALCWFSTTGRAIDTFNRGFSDTYPEFNQLVENLPNRSQYEGSRRLGEGSFTALRSDRVYVGGVVSRTNRFNSVINPGYIANILEQVGQAMRDEGLTTIVLPNISTTRNAGIRTRTYLDIIDRYLGDMQVYMATAVPLDPHGRAYTNISTRYITEKDPSIKPRKRVILHSMNAEALLRNYIPEINAAMFQKPIKASYF